MSAAGRFVRGPALVGDIVTFLVLTAAFSTIFYLLAIFAGPHSTPAGHMLYIYGLMWSPGTAGLVTTWLRRNDLSLFDWRWGDNRWNLLAYLLPLGYAFVGYLAVWLAGWGAFADPATVAKLAARLGWPQAGPAVVVIGYVLLTGTIGIVTSLSSALGEEIGWRGYLTPRMVGQIGFTPAVLVLSVIWAAWHMPLILFSTYNQGAPMWLTLPCFTVMVFGQTMVFVWLRLRSRSLWPCAMLHAAHNLFVQQVFTPLTGPRPATAYTIGEFGLVLPVVAVVLGLYFWRRRDEAITAWNADR